MGSPQGGKDRADYGSYLIRYLSERLTEEFGKGFSERNLQWMRQFYEVFPIAHTVCTQLGWSHIRLLMRVPDEKRREFYARECSESNCSVRQLERQIHTLFYERLLATQTSGKEKVRNEIQTTEPSRPTPLDMLKDPYVL
jgi:hypothetical protein